MWPACKGGPHFFCAPAGPENQNAEYQTIDLTSSVVFGNDNTV
jgi:hypothetical protein